MATRSLDTPLKAEAVTLPYDHSGGFRQTLSNALIITRREVRDSFRDWRILAPIFILTFLFPGLAQFLAGRFANFVEGYGAEIIGSRTIPFLLMVVGFFPISISLVIALETFVGEKERRSLEPLLSTPLTNTELYIGKTLAAMIPPLVSSYGGMAVYLLSLLGGDLQWRPAPMLIVQIMLLTTVQALVMVTGAVVVSSQTTSTRAANLLASFIIIPMALVIQGESVIMFLAPDADSQSGIGALWAIMVGMIFVVILLLRLGNSIFNREELLGRTIDQINIKKFFGKLWQQFRAVDAAGTPARNLVDWYRRGVGLSLSRARVPILLTIGVFITFFIGGLLVGQLPQFRLPLPPNLYGTNTTSTNLDYFLRPELQTSAFGFIVIQNGRILLAALILSIFSFGVAALILTPAVYVILGYLIAQLSLSGNSLNIMLAAVLPHGIIEIPVIVLAAAAALRLGAVITRPPAGMTVGQGWQQALGDTLKIAFGLVIPGLMLAALLEAFVTPQVVVAVLGG
jgi:uncharacterized membrane protein SpoIIM required for sporulation/ABC-type transport system involved in multi-copper enzyme maturation permease subunit